LPALRNGIRSEPHDAHASPGALTLLGQNYRFRQSPDCDIRGRQAMKTADELTALRVARLRQVVDELHQAIAAAERHGDNVAKLKRDLDDASQALAASTPTTLKIVPR
jgi:hypothetical protein